MKKIINVLILTILPMCFATASYMPRVYLTGAAGSNVLGKADILAPIYSTNTNNLFVYAQGKYAYEEQTWEDNTWTGSFGLGYRHILNNTFMLGAYGLADYTTATSGYKFWVLSPGIEGYTQNWEFRANGYFPQNKKRWVDAGWAGDFGDYQYIHFRGHQQWDQRFQYYQETGNGADAEVGRQLYSYKGILFKGYINGFYNNMQNNDDLYGGGARVSVEPNNYFKAYLAYSYDNYKHNALMAEVQISIYDIFNPGKASQELQQNLFKPIERNFATIDSGSSVRIIRGDQPELLGEALRYDNIWFFDPGMASGSNAVSGDGTIEHPFTEFTQDSFGMINPNLTTQNPRLYFAANNTFNLSSFITAGLPYKFELPANWMMQGWNMAPGILQNNHPAEGDARPLFIGGFSLNNNNSINNLRLQNSTDASLSVGIDINNASTCAMNDVTIGTMAPDTSYSTGVYMENSSVSIDNSQICGYNTAGDAVGIEAEDCDTITATNGSLIKGMSTNGNGIGLFLTLNVSGNINLNAINGDGTALFVGNGTNYGCGLYAKALHAYGTITIDTITGSNFIAHGVIEAFGLRAKTGSGITINTITSTNFTATGNDAYGLRTNNAINAIIGVITDSNFTASGSNARGLYATNSSITIGTITSSNFNATGNEEAYGLRADSNNGLVSIGTITNSNFTATGNKAYGLYAEANDDMKRIFMNDIIGSSFSGNGTTKGYGIYTIGIGGMPPNIFNSTLIGTTGSASWG